MGICSSCLQPERHSHTHANHDESEALLNSSTPNPQYGGLSAEDAHVAAVGRARARARDAQPDPETLKREREEMERICQGLAGKLIDVTAQSHTRAPKATADSDAAGQAAEVQPPRVDYAKLFDATFSDHGAPQNVPMSTDAHGSTGAGEVRQEGTAPDQNGEGSEVVEPSGDHETQEQQLLVHQKRWLRHIIESDPDDRHWDWTRVRPVDGMLTLSFDDF